MGASYPFFWLIDTVLWLLLVAVLVYAVMSWLVAFNVINTHNQFVYGALNFLERVTEPLLRPIRRIVPPLGGVDLSALVLLLLIQFARMLLRSVFFG